VIELHAYQYSVHARIARVVLAEKALSGDYIEVNPFATDPGLAAGITAETPAAARATREGAR